MDYHLKVHDLMVAYVNQAMVCLNLNWDYNSMCCDWELRAYNSIICYFPKEGENNLFGLNFQVVKNVREVPH